MLVILSSHRLTCHLSSLKYNIKKTHFVQYASNSYVKSNMAATFLISNDKYFPMSSPLRNSLKAGYFFTGHILVADLTAICAIKEMR